MTRHSHGYSGCRCGVEVVPAERFDKDVNHTGLCERALLDTEERDLQRDDREYNFEAGSAH